MNKTVRCGLAAGLMLASPTFALTLPTLLASPALAQKVAPPDSSAFVLYQFQVRDQEKFPALSAKVRDSLKDFKGEFLKREKMPSIFGGGPSTLSVISFPSVQDARNWLASPTVTELKTARGKVVDVDTYLVEKLD